MEGAVEGLAQARELLGREDTVDLTELERLIAESPCAKECHLRQLGDGIIEVVGECDSEQAAERLLSVLTLAPGVEVVVNRVWTPASAALSEPPPFTD